MIPSQRRLQTRASTDLHPQRSLAATLLRQRLLLTLAAIPLSVVAGSGCILGSGWCDGYDEQRSSDHIITGTLADDSADCPDDPFAASAGTFSVAPYGCAEVVGYGAESIELVEVTLSYNDYGDCNYEIRCTYYETCPGGRPLERDGEGVLASSEMRSDWRRSLAPAVAGLDEPTRQALRAHWSRSGAEEHSSVAAFHRFAMELMAHGAPPDLLLRAHVAASDEIRHAADAYGLASAYAGHAIGPGPLHLGASVPLATDLVAFALSTAREGAVNETMAAWVAQARLERCTDPVVRRVLEAVVAEETQHAELAWETLRWAIEAGGEPVRAALLGFFRGLRVPVLDDDASSHPDLSAYGVLSPSEERQAMQQCLNEVLLPVASALLQLRKHAA